MTHHISSAANAFLARTKIVFFLAIIALPLSSCDLASNLIKHDRDGNRSVQDLKDAMAERSPEFDDEDSDGSVPTMQPYISGGNDHFRSMPLVSISVNQSIPIRDVLFELAEQAEYDLELDPAIRGSLIFTARNRPLDEVVARISDMAGLRYKFEDDVLRVELDNPYNKTYQIDYLSYVRSSSGSVSSDVNVGAAEAGADSGSQFSASSTSESDFWGELETNLGQILVGQQQVLRTNSTPRITATEQNPDVAAVSPNGEGVSPPDAVLNVDALPVDDIDDTTSVDGEEGGASVSFAVNRQAGLVSVYATQKQHKEVQNYLKLLRRAVTAQVLIEAKVLEVTLNDEFVTGVDWRSLNLASGELVTNFFNFNSNVASITNLTQPNLPISGDINSLTGSGVGSNAFVAGYTGNDLNVLIEALQGFGHVKALASPRLSVLNNQSAVLNVSTNRVFFELEVEVTRAEGAASPDVTVESEIRNVPEGVIINVQPSIDLNNRTVSMAVRPTVTRVVNQESDPGLQFALAQVGAAVIGQVESFIPEVNVQQLDSVIQVKSGQPVVMGGLLQDRSEVEEQGVPVLGEVPVVGALFRDQADRVQKTELIVFLKATILDSPGDSIHNTDKDIYRTFAKDRRPFKL